MPRNSLIIQFFIALIVWGLGYALLVYWGHWQLAVSVLLINLGSNYLYDVANANMIYKLINRFKKENHYAA